MKRKNLFHNVAVFAYALFIALSWIFGFGPGREISRNFTLFSLDMLKVLPCAFILIGLFETWIKKETVERHFGEKSGFLGFVWGILLAGTTVGGLYVAFPVAYSLYRKGARLSVIFTYIGASGVCRIPMTVFEASFVGLKFTVIRLMTAIPLVVLTSILLGNYLRKREYRILEGKE